MRNMRKTRWQGLVRFSRLSPLVGNTETGNTVAKCELLHKQMQILENNRGEGMLPRLLKLLYDSRPDECFAKLPDIPAQRGEITFTVAAMVIVHDFPIGPGTDFGDVAFVLSLFFL